MRNFWSAMRSVLSSFLGVQSEERRKQDFENGRPIYFIVSGLILTAAFIISVIFAVQWALSLAGK